MKKVDDVNIQIAAVQRDSVIVFRGICTSLSPFSWAVLTFVNRLRPKHYIAQYIEKA